MSPGIWLTLVKKCSKIFSKYQGQEKNAGKYGGVCVKKFKMFKKSMEKLIKLIKLIKLSAQKVIFIFLVHILTILFYYVRTSIK